jgi:ABC-type sugar transport system permease subunit
MTTVTLQNATTRSTEPRWYRFLVVWRFVSAAIIALALVAALAGTGIETGGPLLWTLLVALLGALIGAGLAIRGTLRVIHLGRLAGFVLDFLMAVVVGFIALNRMEMFTAVDTLGEAFNGSIAWIAIIVVGFLVQGLAEKAGDAQKTMRAIARWTMLVGLALLALSMGLLPGLVEFARRLVQTDVLPIALLALAAGTFARLLYSDSALNFFGSTQSQNETIDGMVFVAPNVLGFLTFFAGPLVVSLFISFTEWDGLTDAKFVGLQNYIDLFSDELFLRSLRNIVVFGLMSIPFAVVLALFLAALLNSKLPGMKGFRAIYFLPTIGGVVGVTLIWKQLFDSVVGYLNFTILKVTEWVNAILGSGIEAPQPQWISDADIALISTAILFVWQVIGFNTVLFLAGMQGIDGALYEAAEIDGASPWKKFRHITVPTLRPTTVFVVATTTILALQLFNEPFILQSPNRPSGPGNATLSPVIYLYEKAFQQFSIGYASAVAWVLFILIFGITLLYFRRGGDEGVLSK